MIVVLRQALRALGRSPGFALAAVATFAIGIGANATVFGVVNAVLLKSYPYRDADRVVALYESDPGSKNDRAVLSPANFHDWRAAARSFTAMAAARAADFTLGGDAEPARLAGARVTWTLPAALGITPQVGRAFRADDDAPGAPDVVMLTDRLWRTRFGADRGVVGRVLQLNGRPATVVGVLPAGVSYPNDRADVWAPFAMSDSAWGAQRGNHSLQGVARLAPGVTPAQARAELTAIQARIGAEFEEERNHSVVPVIPLHEATTGSVRPVLLVLLGAVSFVLLLACANVANLTLARGAGRQRDVAVRAAMGARPWHLARPQLAESLVLGAAGGGLGLLLAAWACAALPAVVPTSIPRLDEAGVDWRVALFTFGTALLASVLAGVLPALQTARLDLNGVLKDGNRSSTGGVTRARLRDGLFVAEVAMALLLLTGAGLALTSLGRLLSVKPGFAPEQVMTAHLSLPRARYANDTAAVRFWEQLLPRLRAIPGVRTASAGTPIPMGGGVSMGAYFIEGRGTETADARMANFYMVGDDYFQSMGVPLARGRDFGEADRQGAEPVAVVSEALARKEFAGADPIGQQLMPWGSDGPKFRVVGVVGDVKHRGLTDEGRAAMYLPLRFVGPASASLVLRTAGEPAAVAGAIRAAVAELDPTLAVADLRPMSGLVMTTAARPRFSALLLGAFAACAVALALVGIYGVVAQSVAQRAAEFSVRMALGARPGDVWRDVLGGALRRTAVGIAVGLAGAAALTRLLAEELYDTSPLEPRVLAAVSLVVAVIAALGSWAPARRAMRASPMAVLRTE
ncbi:ABC transporter permease [Roseisolibacter sp. H3M3-2]|uniref:ABC transporter permease n=1 Tax=Roseisolibacter sp. H3M3-2 TaxID=3031323 RepID=UPI0023DC16F0|nr:ABC transporter permease [Roseisolibacter sp. H3M3-2]MDF1502464.1 ABC transporter permease [Roseisolibacter sp. H3M3-2]